MAYTLRPARGPDEDLAAIRLFGHGLYGWDPADLATATTREDLANRFGLRMALREGHTVVVDHDGEVVAASRITPSPWDIHDPETGELEHWETVAVHPDHRGKGLSEPLRREALATSEAKVVKSRIKDGNPKSWRVAEKLGFIRTDDDGPERIYVMRAASPTLQSRPSRVPLEPTMKKNATAAAARADAALVKLAAPKFLEDTARGVGNWAQKQFGGGAPQPGGTNWGDTAGEFWRNHGGKVMGGLGGLAAGALGGQFSGEDSSMRWLLPLLGAGVGAGGGALYDNPEMMAKLKGLVGMREGDAAIKDRFAYRDEQNQQMNSPAYRGATKQQFPQGMISPEQQGQNAGRQLQDWMRRRGGLAKVAADALTTVPPRTKPAVAAAKPISQGVGHGGPIDNNSGAAALTKQASPAITSVAVLGDVAAAALTKVAGIAEVPSLSDINWRGIWDKNKNAIIGGGVGALAGGLGGGLMNGEDAEGETHTGRNAGLGALAGLALGAGGGHLLDRPQHWKATSNEPGEAQSYASPPQLPQPQPQSSNLGRDIGAAGGATIGMAHAATRRPQLNGGGRAGLSKAVLRALLSAGVGGSAGGAAGAGADWLRQ